MLDSSPNCGFFEVFDERVQFRGKEEIPLQMLLQPLPLDCSKMTLAFRVIQTERNDIGVGLISALYSEEAYTKGINRPHYIRYNGQYGSLNESGRLCQEDAESTGFLTGQQVQITVDFREGLFSVEINGKLKMRH